MSRSKDPNQSFSRRAFLKRMGLAPALFHAAPFSGLPFGFLHAAGLNPHFPLADLRLTPSYPAESPLEDVLRKVAPGSDEYVTEKYAADIGAVLGQWSQVLKASARDISALGRFLDTSVTASSLTSAKETKLRSDHGIEIVKRRFSGGTLPGREQFLKAFRDYLGLVMRVDTAEFQITAIEEVANDPPILRLDIRYDLVITHTDERREERVGSWSTEWTRAVDVWTVTKWEVGEETRAVASAPVFIDVTHQALGATESYKQMLHGSDYWRTILDGACGIDLYGNNGIAMGDFDNDGFDDLYVCQPSGLPNRLYRNRGDGTFEDVTEKSGLNVLDNSSCALFADFENKGLQDLLVVCGSGPLLFLNQGNGTFSLKRDAFKFVEPPQGTFTHAALADYDCDGRLDIYFCLYSYYLGLDQYHYPVPYFDARNGPPNFLLRNEGNATFIDRTEEAGLNTNNNRYSFACAWGNSGASDFPDLYVANDFGRSNLYRNNGNGTFTDISKDAHVEEAGAGMSAAWSDFDNDGNQDIYAANMWSSAGQRVSTQKIFHPSAPDHVRTLYRRHARGNSLYRDMGDCKFQNVSEQAGVAMGRWSWCSDFWDFDHDGYPDLYIANGYVSGADRSDLSSFFWRQVVGRSPDDSTPSQAYEHGWNAVNELIRSDSSWSGYERNVLYSNNRDGTFSEISGPAGLDFLDDSRSFALADIDHDGRLELILKNRTAPQIRILRNAMKDIGNSIAFRLRGTKSNRDGIGTVITLEAGALRQTKSLQAGSGFLAQHTKELFWGVGSHEGTVRATVRWPSGLSQVFENLSVNQRIEIEEGSATFAAKTFAAPSESYLEPSSMPTKEDELPSAIQTWLIEPLKAPEFSLQDLAGNTHELRSFLGSYVLLNFCEASDSVCRELLARLNQYRTAFAANKLNIVAVNVDETARSLASPALGFPVLVSTAEVAGIYNIIYRYLFDRRRDLAIPTSFLLDQDSMIVKLYQGPIDPQQVLADLKSIPATPADRMRKALPFSGTLYQDAFQRNDFTYGVALFQHGYLDAAAGSFREVIAQKPDDAEAYYNLGTLNLRRNDLQQARQYLEQTVKLRPDYPEAWNNLGMIAAQQGQADEAVRNFQQSLTLRPNYAIAMLNLGNFYRRQGAFDKAQPLLSHALTLEPDDPEANYNLGMFYAQQGQLQQAQDYLEKAVALRPDYPEALNNLGVLFVRNKDFARAEAQFKTCVRLAPGFDQSYLNLARLYAMQHDKGKAIAILQDLLRLQPANRAAQQMLEMLN
ncbi:FG-GAP-like repeat-containing protein [Alloacidobacterium sp.]|uniref:FG-GAP-like repeat-containing protein n=1 Tax=Alloacidobacterium sp. TaxID=2951999 RepID=UPI002D2E39FD|nr:FG-GAP-like repeat-containing protein [Alloacidobacterium sp.]HYK36616.1 FG-GAP-like repeat-containing protein [Alloacidobacterium sp.]